MSRRFYLSIFSVAITIIIPLTAVAANFSDVSDTHPNALAIQTLKDANIVSGYGDGTFKPEKSVSRAEALAITLKAADVEVKKSSLKVPFTDVAEDTWFFPAVAKGAALGKLKGYGDKTFRPNNPVTLPESLSLILSFFEVNTKKISVEPVIYQGLDPNAWYSKQAQYAKNNNLIEPDEKGHVSSTTALSRSELAELVYRMRIIQQTGKPFDITKNWATLEYQDNFWKLRYPSDWEVFKGLQNSVIWKRDQKAGQVFFTRVSPRSARVSLSVVENPENLTPGTYFARMKDAYQKSYPATKPTFTEITLSGRSALNVVIPERRVIDVAIALPNGKFLVLYGESGEAPIGEFLKKQVEAIELSYQYVEKPLEPPRPVTPLEDRLATLRENILMANKWKDVSPLFPDKKLIDTDAIGIGTGPVDYFFTKEANQTIKVERNSGTILNIREEETSAF